ncbi:MAG: sulfotransferase, partial [bacterium]|nr:sulfotransferase [bacterium]
HVIHMHRDPLETIPSGASLNTALWRMHADEVDPARVGHQWIERMAWTNRRALAAREAMPGAERRFTDVRFRSAVADPLAQVQRIYDAVGIPFSEEARAAMSGWIQEDEGEKLPKHRYAAEDFGLSEALIREEFAEYSARFLHSEDGKARRT